MVSINNARKHIVRFLNFDHMMSWARKRCVLKKKITLTKVTVGMSKVLWATLICVKGVEKGERIRTY